MIPGYNNRFRRGLAAKPQEWVSAQEQETREEWNTNTPPILINRGTLQTTAGGLPQFKSTSGTSGGTTLLEVDPDTGTVTIRGGLVAQITLDLGTVNNTKLAGTPELIGTLTNSRLINNGTWNSGTFGTPQITGGTLASAFVGTPNATGGTHNNAFLGTPQTAGGTIGTPVITGTPTFGTQGGSAALSADGNFAMQFFSGSPIIAFRYNGTTFRFVTAGTI